MSTEIFAKPNPSLCNAPAPPHFRETEESEVQYCVLKKGHPIVEHRDDKGTRLILEGHVSQFGKRWPTGNKNLEWL